LNPEDETDGLSEMSVQNYNYLLRNILEECNSQVQCRHNVTKIQDQLLTTNLPIF